MNNTKIKSIEHSIIFHFLQIEDNITERVSVRKIKHLVNKDILDMKQEDWLKACINLSDLSHIMVEKYWIYRKELPDNRCVY